MEETPFTRFCEAYIAMTMKALYRPFAPSDGLGHVTLSIKALYNPKVLDNEAKRYAIALLEEETTNKYFLGCTNFRENRAFVYTLEAARCLCGVAPKTAITLLRMAIEEIEVQHNHNVRNTF